MEWDVMGGKGLRWKREAWVSMGSDGEVGLTWTRASQGPKEEEEKKKEEEEEEEEA
jgi:hypothetical protein